MLPPLSSQQKYLYALVIKIKRGTRNFACYILTPHSNSIQQIYIRCQGLDMLLHNHHCCRLCETLIVLSS